MLDKNDMIPGEHPGVKGAQVEELWSLDDEQFNELMPIHGLIFLFKWVQDDELSGNIVQDNRLDKIFFAKQVHLSERLLCVLYFSQQHGLDLVQIIDKTQLNLTCHIVKETRIQLSYDVTRELSENRCKWKVINNACATQAILSVLLNCKHADISLGPNLEEFKNFCQSFDANMRGLALSNSDVIREVHNSFSRQTLFEYDSKQASKDDDVFHFVSYVPIDGRLYELDGLKDGPIDLGPCSVGKQWVQAAKPIIQKRINKYNEGEIHFNLMAIVTDRKTLYEKQKANVCDPEELERLQALIEEEIRKSKRYQIENIRRKHNYLPLIMELLKILAKEGKLVPLYQKAKEKALEKESKKNKV
ncbi:Ubiquitin carboxyl-terminal hydrolase isozyme L5 [Acromyrmex echinatior]|uniref:Ubiquitin carboxyl-terminal hydrolase n=1 Tax=Acromyrmex echinatior TaxID=103372 RepID=F4W9H5_ACREC|nr:Ubiquitin carboxyl-terminal hydrolase isozyme L5 [Acromyrmex echinatior]